LPVRPPTMKALARAGGKANVPCGCQAI